MSKFKIGLMGTSQLSFPGDAEKLLFHSADELSELGKTLGFDLYVYPQIVITRNDALKAVGAMEEEKVDLLLSQVSTFSAGDIAQILARLDKAALGIWAVPEEALSGIVSLNSLCGLNMYKSIIDHYMKDYKVKVKWFYGNVSDEMFARRLAVSVRALKAIKKMRNSRIALVGGIAPGFNDLYFDERQLNKLFDGMYFNRLHEYSEIKDLALSYGDSEVQDIVAGMLNECKGVHKKADKLVMLNAKFLKAYRRFIEENQYDAVAVSCWPKFQTDFEYSVCDVVAGLNDDGIPTACEGDVLSAICMLALKYISDDYTTLMDLSAFDEEDNSVLLWHCGPTCKRFCRHNGYTLGLNYTALPQTKGKEPVGCGIVRDMVFDPGPATVMRITGECDKYLLFDGEFLGNTKESLHGSRGWLGNLSLNNEPVKALDLINTILINGFQHHFPVVPGKYNDEIKEFFAWLDVLPIQKIGYEDCLQLI